MCMRALWPGLAPSADSICFVVGFHSLFEADFERQEVLDGLEIPFEIRVLLEVVPSVTHVRVEGIGARALSPRFPLSTPLKLTDLLCSESSLLTSFNADASLKPWTETSYAA